MPSSTPFELPQMEPCVFCERIAGRRDDWAVIERTNTTASFVNPRQFEEGQALVIPTRHAPTILDLNDDEAQEIMAAVRRLSKAMIEAFHPDGITIYQNNGVASMQEVPHCHVHVVPRRTNDNWGRGGGPPHIAALEKAELEANLKRNTAPLERQQELAQRIKAGLA